MTFTSVVYKALSGRRLTKTEERKMDWELTCGLRGLHDGLPVLSRPFHNLYCRGPNLSFAPSCFTMKVAVIGAGATGLTCIKCCKDQGLKPVCFEQEDSIGGLWHFTEEERHSSVYRSTVINTSKEMMCFSDFPIPREYPPFMHHCYIMKYLHLYAEAFDLYKVIRYRTKVVNVKPASDFEDSGRWEIFFQELDKENPEEVHKEVYDAVMLCIGHHSEPSWATFTGMAEFSGVKIHSHSYKDFKPFENKSVLVIGTSHSLYFNDHLKSFNCLENLWVRESF